MIDCSPEGHQPEVNTRIFQGVQQPVCIVMVSRSKKANQQTPATVHFRALPVGKREEKFEVLKNIHLNDTDWIECPDEWRAPFLPVSQGAWSTFPALGDLFVYKGSGVQPKRTWVYSPDAESLYERWKKLISAPDGEKEVLFHATLRDGMPADRHIRSIVREALPGYTVNLTPIIDEKGMCHPPVRYGFRSFNRQWIIPDTRVITQPNHELWKTMSEHQIFLTASSDFAPSNGPSLTFSNLAPDLNYYKGSSGGRVYPLWRDDKAQQSNIPPHLLPFLNELYGAGIAAGDLMAYIAAVAAHSAYTARFHEDLSTPGLRIPLTADSKLFFEAVEMGKRVLWLHTFGERMADAKNGRPAGPPRLPQGKAPTIPKGGAISDDPNDMPNHINYDAGKHRLLVGHGFIDNVSSEVWNYQVSGMQVILQWFSYRKLDRERPIIGDRRPPSPLGNIQPDHWLPEYTTELLNVLNVLGLLVELEPRQADLLEQICAGPLISEDELKAAGALEVPAVPKQMKSKKEKPLHLFAD